MKSGLRVQGLRPLEHFPLIENGSRDGLIDAVANTDPEVAIERLVSAPQDSPIASIFRFDLKDSFITAVDFKTQASYRYIRPDRIGVVFAYRGSGRASTGREAEVALNGTTGGIIIHEGTFEFAARSVKIGWFFSEETLRRRLSLALGVPVPGPVALVPRLDGRSPQCRALVALMRSMLEILDVADPVQSRGVLMELEDALFSAFIQSVGRAGNAIAPETPRLVTAIETFLSGNRRKSVRLADLSRLTGTPERTILSAFKKHRGYSPLAFARRLRLARAREMLLAGDAVCTVTEIALICGYCDLQHFSNAYAKAYGEPPSALLAGRRRAARAFANAPAAAACALRPICGADCPG